MENQKMKYGNVLLSPKSLLMFTVYFTFVHDLFKICIWCQVDIIFAIQIMFSGTELSHQKSSFAVVISKSEMKF